MNAVREQVKEYYGRTVRSSRGRRAGCACSSESIPEEVRAVLPLIDEEIIEQSYGCGSPIPPDLAGLTVLDLGCGTGRDAFVASKLVGSSGRVIGVDMTDEQLVVARRHVSRNRESWACRGPTWNSGAATSRTWRVSALLTNRSTWSSRIA
jgi:2-polyprenyl-3-methyl-5-hydroxy-6-metoxy-1,4-benzoquinol methylase